MDEATEIAVSMAGVLNAALAAAPGGYSAEAVAAGLRWLADSLDGGADRHRFEMEALRARLDGRLQQEGRA